MAVKMHDIFEIDVVVQRELAASVHKYVRGKFVLEVVDVRFGLSVEASLIRFMFVHIYSF